MSDRLAILIGNGRFEADASLPELFGPRHDVASLGRLLSDPEIGNYIVFELVDRDSDELAAELEPLFAMCGADTSLLLYYAGHVIAEPGRGLYLASADTRLDTVKETAFPVSAFKSLLRRSAPGAVAVVLDCCYTSPAGDVDEHDVEHQLRRIRGDVSPDLHVIASPSRTRVPADRETTTDTGLEGSLTRCIVEGLATGAADRDGDNVTRTSELNEYLGFRLGDDRPLWAGPLEGVDPEIVANPHPIEGIDPGGYDADRETSDAVRQVLLGIGVALMLVAIGIAAFFLLRDEQGRREVRLDGYYSGSTMPDDVALVDDLGSLRSIIDRTGWIEHHEPLDGGGPRYPSVVSFQYNPGNAAAPGAVELGLRQWVQLDLAAGVHGVGVACAAGLNIAEVVVELVDGTRYLFDVRTEQAGVEFFGFASRAPLHRVRITSTSTRLVAEDLYIYAEDEHPRSADRTP